MKQGDQLIKDKKYIPACHKLNECIKSAEQEDDFESLSLANFKLGKLAYHIFKDYPKAKSYMLEF